MPETDWPYEDLDGFRRWHFDLGERQRIAEMTTPVRCLRCYAVYDLGTITEYGRYTDCTVWTSPCCKQTVDDRPRGWSATPAIEYIDKAKVLGNG